MARLQEMAIYQGSYTVELWRDARTDHLPKNGVTIDANKVTVPVGTVQQVMGGIQFYAQGKGFSWGYKFIKRILDADGQELWRNWDFK